MAKETMKEITERLEKGVHDFYTSERMRDYLTVMSKFHSYSLNNCILIAMQCPWATQVAGYKKWQSFDRHVRKGAKAIRILAPYKYTIEVESDKKDKCGNQIKEKKEFISFRQVSVFDISQTDGKELPGLVDELQGEVMDYDKLMAAIQDVAPFPISIEPVRSEAKGYCDFTKEKIVIREGMSELQNVKTAIHEMAHGRIHQPKGKEDEPIKARDQKEVEAESIAFVVCSHYGLDTSDYSFGYVAAWAADKNTDVLRASMETIQTESRSIIDDIDNAMERNVSLNGMSHRDIERTVMQVVAETIQSYGIAAEPITAVIYGSRTREDYHATSDLDVLVEYQGDIREDALFNLLHEQDISIGGMEVDVNPIRSEQSGSAAEYLARIARLQEKDRKEMTV